ncbi:MAG: Rieske 2Fe-2S domain-containing protein [Alphaproteobacteria bacterium]|nr:Rieske 2Fe-2S domain-containing protein [Alphaproteobacteria bacterium]
MTLTAPAAWYRDPALWPRERTHIFAPAWQFATHESALPEPGAYWADALAGYPVLIVRDEAGALRGFHNVCRHRAGPLVHAGVGRCDGALTCQYHGWRYALDGRLRHARDFGAADGFDPRDYGLFPIQVQSWRGLLFVAVADDAPPFADLIAPIERRIGARDWSDLRIAAQRTHPLRCNWKTYVENYLEGYHVPVLHPGLNADIRAEEYQVHVEGRVALHEAPPRDGGVYDGVWAWLWPNIGLNIYRRGLMIERMAPIGHAKTRLDYLYLTPNGEPVPDETLALSDAVTAEDSWIVARVQENLDAGIYTHGRLSPKHEGGVAAFQRWVGEAFGL